MIGWFKLFRISSKFRLVLFHYCTWKTFDVDWWMMVNCFRLPSALLFCIYLCLVSFYVLLRKLYLLGALVTYMQTDR